MVTETGGASELASSCAAWAEMPENPKERIRNKALWHRYSHSRTQISPELANLPMSQKWPDQLCPAVIRNPVNGFEALFIASRACKGDGMDQGSSAELLDELTAFVTQECYVYRHK